MRNARTSLQTAIVSAVVVVFGLSVSAAQAQTTQSDCPRILFSSSDVSAFGGDVVEVEAAVLGRPSGTLTFNWTLPTGSIVSGQATSRIRATLPKTKKRMRIDLRLEIPELAGISNCKSWAMLPMFVKGPGDWEHGISRLADLVLNVSQIPCGKPRQLMKYDARHLINVIAIPQDIQSSTSLSYNFWVSGGIVKQSKSMVTWDLSGVKPGTYAIEANIDDGTGFGPQLRRFVTVDECTEESIASSTQ